MANEGGNNPGGSSGGRSNRGFAAMDAAKQREIASKGGSASGGNFANDPERAREAGRKGGEVSGGNFANDPQRASEAGRKGGEASRGGRNRNNNPGSSDSSSTRQSLRLTFGLEVTPASARRHPSNALAEFRPGFRRARNRTGCAPFFCWSGRSAGRRVLARRSNNPQSRPPCPLR